MTDQAEVTPTARPAKKSAAKKSNRKPAKKASKKKASKKKDTKKKDTKREGSGRKSQFSGKKITKLVKENPRRDGTHGHHSFALIKSGMSYESYIAAGGRLQDLAYDVANKYVKVA